MRGTAFLDCRNLASYTGNLNADGPYVELGFKPALIIVKEISPNAGHYYMYDSTRSTINPTAHVLWANQNYDENSSTITTAVTSNNMDMYSSGFKMRSNKKVEQTDLVELTSIWHGQKHHQSTCMVVALMPANINN